jgi:hypothetical protein
VITKKLSSKSRSQVELQLSPHGSVEPTNASMCGSMCHPSAKINNNGIITNSSGGRYRKRPTTASIRGIPPMMMNNGVAQNPSIE